MKETVQERTVLKEKVAETFINSKNTMAVLDTDELERHTGGAFHSIFVSAGGTNFARDISEQIREIYGNKIHIFENCIPMSVRAAETTAEGSGVL